MRKSTPEVIKLFTSIANIAKTEHGQINPGYKSRYKESCHRLFESYVDRTHMHRPITKFFPHKNLILQFLCHYKQIRLRPSKIFTLHNTHTTIDQSIHYVLPNELHYQHPTVVAIDHASAFRNSYNPYGHNNVNAILHSPVPMVGHSTLCCSKPTSFLSVSQINLYISHNNQDFPVDLRVNTKFYEYLIKQ